MRRCGVRSRLLSTMEKEREALERQIQLLQGLINSHRNLHGDAPASSRWRNPAQPCYGSHRTYRGGISQRGNPREAQQLPSNPANTWRKKYSLVNRPEQAGPAPRTPCKGPSVSDAAPPAHLRAARPAPLGAARPAPLGAARPAPLGAARPAPVSFEKSRKLDVRVNDRIASVSQSHTSSSRGGRSDLQKVKDLADSESPSTSALWQPKAPAQAALPAKVTAKVSLEAGARSFPSDKTRPTRGASEKLISPPVTAEIPVATTPPNPSMDPAKGRLAAHVLFSSPKSSSTPNDSKLHRARKNKYTWVSNSARTSLNVKKGSPGGTKKPASADAARTKSPVTSVVAKGRKSGVQGKPRICRNRYQWKAGQPSQATSGSTLASPCRSVPQNVAQGSVSRPPDVGSSQNEGKDPVLAASSRTTLKDQIHSSYKVKSRTKIIRRRSNSSSPTEKKSPPLAPFTMKTRYSLRRKSSPRTKTQQVVKRSSPRGLVHITKHRLRRLPPSKQPDATRGPASPPVRSPPSSRMIRTRYRIVKRSASPAPAPSCAFSPSYTWRTRALNRSRTLPPSRIQPGQQRWRSRGLCFIGGDMYRVSANKLSKTWSPATASKQTPKAGKKDVGSPSPGSSFSGRSATPSRYIVSRAVQRSLAIIRQAQHRKEKEYCMYFNRFGKCKRAQSCPYIHDPEKVAVCTRFLRGTCKKTDGTCPFSHKMSKDKMPVCSYFLKGACHNSDCPYSHVYVSRKAALCQDFIKGYCPLGVKCKEKHTLLCPDYARDGRCARGTKCQLQHHQRKRRLDNLIQSGSEQPLQPAEERTRSGVCSSDDEGPGAASHKLPSFISLNCSFTPPSDAAPLTKKVKLAEDAGKPLQIKPRL